MKYYIRVMRPTFHRTTLTLEARSEEEAVRSALWKVARFSQRDWLRIEAEVEPPVIEIVFSEEEAEGDPEAAVLEYVRNVQYEYALLQADLESGQGAFIAPMWLKDLTELAAADITRDWSEALSGVSRDEIAAFHAWLTRQGRPSNVVDFFAERDKRRGVRTEEPDRDD